MLDRVIAVRNDKTVYRNGDRCIKVFNAEYSKADVLNEALNQARIEETGLNIPKILEVAMIDSKWAIVSEYIKGKTLTQLIKESPDKKNEYIELLVDLHMSIHQKSCPLLNRQKDKIDRRIADSELNATTRYDLHSRLEAMPRCSEVCHGDFNPSNIIITEAGIPYIIDWSHATQGNACADVASTYLLLRMKGYSDEAEIYLDIYCQKSGVARQYIQKWLPIVAAAQSVKSNEMERKFLISQVDQLNYQ